MTMFFASLLALLYLYLTWQVIKRRRAYRQPYGSPQDYPDLVQAINAHGNFQQYTPLFLILLYLYETHSGNHWLSGVLGLIFLLGRLSHAYSQFIAEPQGLAQGSRLRVTFRFRFYAMAQTLISLLVLAVLLLLQCVTYWIRGSV